jgi:hypothetical protein
MLPDFRRETHSSGGVDGATSSGAFRRSCQRGLLLDRAWRDPSSSAELWHALLDDPLRDWVRNSLRIQKDILNAV